jgi:hypothetical protein
MVADSEVQNRLVLVLAQKVGFGSHQKPGKNVDIAFSFKVK